MPIILRNDVNRPLTHQELDGNFKYIRENLVLGSQLNNTLAAYATAEQVNTAITAVSSSAALAAATQDLTGKVATIPTPMIGVNGRSNVINIQFTDLGFDFAKNNAELFLFRYRNAKRKKIIDRNNQSNGTKKKIPAKWVHPTTADASTKWNGWKFFNGEQSLYNPQTFSTEGIPGRVTEYSIPANLLPYQRFNIEFNRYMFWRKTSVAGTTFDANFISEANPTTTTDVLDMYVGMGGSSTGMIGKFALAVAMDNPLATKQNGLCPKIFGTLSEPFYSVLARENGKDQPFVDIKLVTETDAKHLRIRK